MRVVRYCPRWEKRKQGFVRYCRGWNKCKKGYNTRCENINVFVSDSEFIIVGSRDIAATITM